MLTHGSRLAFTRSYDLVTSLHYGLDKIYLADKLKIHSFENHVGHGCQKFFLEEFVHKMQAAMWYVFIRKRRGVDIGMIWKYYSLRHIFSFKVANREYEINEMLKTKK